MFEPGKDYMVQPEAMPEATSMNVWFIDTHDGDALPQAVFAPQHATCVITSATGAMSREVHLTYLESNGWALIRNAEGWAEPAPGWTATLDVPTSLLTMTDATGTVFYEGSAEPNADWLNLALHTGHFLAFSGAISNPEHIPDAYDDGQLYALICPIRINA
ncbi:hypothetical protein [Streptomyces sp. CS014]|uniref:hypothetical protein n=1 Tax=Streptomyces sp. CS014 TaxID=2162707 RepID=UPI000D50901E|nr:hypothetical protein [Streptomyces sp. CS014]PVD04464.1 hypothetical protein DBP12_03295 [Streptomyces sp. CS014]